MLTFIIPLKSARVSSSWERVSQLLERCLKSVCNQTSPNFQVLVVCHEKPSITFEDSNVTWLSVDFPIPPRELGHGVVKDKDCDKNRKIWTGLNYAQQLNPSHVMFVDADDCISRHLASFVEQNSKMNGWFLNCGYDYREGSNRVYFRHHGFHKRCGTSHVLAYDLLKPFISLKFDEVDWDYLHHQFLVPIFQNRGTPLSPLPFAGAVYVYENGENIWNQKRFLRERKGGTKKVIYVYCSEVYKSLVSKPLTPSIRDDFELYSV